MSEIQSTEDAILTAARKVFSAHGLQGARMQDIADEAGINKALLHYYFRSKEKLFEIIFQEAFSKFAGSAAEMMTSEAPLFEKIDAFIDKYIDILLNNLFLPGFVIAEINNKPERMIDLISSKGLRFDVFERQVAEEVARGNIRAIEGKHLFVSIIALCVFPFAGRPILKSIIFGNESIAYDAFLQERKQEVKRFVIAALRPDNQINEI